MRLPLECDPHVDSRGIAHHQSEAIPSLQVPGQQCREKEQKLRKQRHLSNLVDEMLQKQRVPGSFSRIVRCLARLFLGLDVVAELGYLRNYEKKLLASYCRRKMNVRSRSRQFDNMAALTYLVQEVQSKSNCRKKEYNIKFVLSRVIKQLKRQFLEQAGPGTVFGSAADKERAFYAHYFGEIARRQGRDLKEFYFFKNHTHIEDGMPKSVTAALLGHWKGSSKFIFDMQCFLARDFEIHFCQQMVSKICNLGRKWASTFVEQDQEKSVKKMISWMSKKGSKMPKTIREARYAVEQIRKILFK